jgi:hypothetical protein
MSDTASEPTMLPPDQAARELIRIERRTEPLLQRTIGLTWMFWGVINAGIFLTYEAIGFANPSAPWATVEYGVAWVPWVIMGAGATTVLWRSLAVVMPPNAGSFGKVSAMVITIFLALVLGGSAAIIVARAPIDGFSWATLAVGIGAAVAGGSGLTTSSRAERSFWLAGGLCVAALAIALDIAAGRLGYGPAELLQVVGPVATTALLFGGGLYTEAS